MSSRRREPAELAALLARKAREDATAMRELAGNPQISDEIVGFHAQWTEKWLKALMAQRGLRQVRIHDLDRLAELLEEDGMELPIGRDRLDELTQCAVPLRYDDLLDAEPLDRDPRLPGRRSGQLGWAQLAEVAEDVEGAEGEGDTATG